MVSVPSGVFSFLDDNTVGADDSVGPNDDQMIFQRADTPRALVPLRFTALVVGPYERLPGNALCVCISLIEYDLVIIPKNPQKSPQNHAKRG